MAKCKICDGARHVRREGVSVPCECLLRERLEGQLKDAGLPEYLADEDWVMASSACRGAPGSVAKLQRVARTIRTNGIRKIVGVFGGDDICRRYAVGLILRDAAKGSKSILATPLYRVVDAEFEDDRKAWTRSLESVDVLWIKADLAKTHKLNETVLLRIGHSRFDNRRATLISAAKPWGKMKRQLGAAADFLQDSRYAVRVNLDGAA